MIGPAILISALLVGAAGRIHRRILERSLAARYRRDARGIIVGAETIEIDGTNTARFDYDVLEQLHEFTETARLRNIDYRLVNVPAAPTTPTHSH